MYHQIEENNGVLAPNQQGDVAKNEDDEDAALINAVFEPIRLPEVRFAPSPPAGAIIPQQQQQQQDASHPPSSSTPHSLAPTPAPPNSARTTASGADQQRQLQQSPTLPMPPRRSVRGRQQTPRRDQKANLHGDGEEEEEEDTEGAEQYSINLIAHKDSLEDITMPMYDGQISAGGRLSASSAGGMLTPLGTMDTQETGEAELDTARSMVATLGGTSSHSSELEQYTDDHHHFADQEDDDDDGESVVIRRGSSVLSAEMVNDAMANAIRNASRASSAVSTIASDNGGGGGGGNRPTMRQRDALQLELDKRVAAHRLSSGSSSSVSAAGGGGRDVHVRTPLNDPRSPFKPKAYTAFEPDKQEQIRLEIGSTGPSGIRRIVDRFQNGQFVVQQQHQQQQEMNTNNHMAEQVEQQQSMTMPTTVPSADKVAPMMRQSSLQTLRTPPSSPTIQIVEEQQRSVAEILSKFQQRDFVHPNGTEEKKSPQATRPSNLGRCGTGASIWATSSVRNTQPSREPAPGSLAAIRKSLGSLPSTPTSVGSVSPTPGGGAERNSSPTNGPSAGVPSPQRASMPKTVSEFYRLWGAAQAATADSAKGAGGTATSIGNGSPFAAAAGVDRVTQC